MNKLRFSRSAISKLQAIILLIAVLVPLVTFDYYIQNRIQLSHQLPPSTPTPSPSPTPTLPPSASTAPAGLVFSNLFLNTTEAWPGQLVNVSVLARNTGTENISYAVPFLVNGKVVEAVPLQLAAGASETVKAALNESSLGTYQLVAGGKSGQFSIVPTGKYTLHYISNPAGISFTLDGASYISPYSELVDAGPHTIEVPATTKLSVSGWGQATENFAGWSDGSHSLSRTVNVQGEIYLSTSYAWSGSCPSLFAWNGTGYSFVADVNDGTGWLGYLEHFQPDGSMVFSYNYPYDYIKLDSTQVQPVNGFYNFNIAEMSNEIFYLDSVKMVAIDHPANVNVFSTASTFIYNLTGKEQFTL